MAYFDGLIDPVSVHNNLVVVDEYWNSPGKDVVQFVVQRISQHKGKRIWVDGCFDLMHFGHANAFRQARSLGDVLVVGLNPDSEIIKHKGGPPIMNDAERYISVKSCKWVDEVVENVPYALDETWMKLLFEKYSALVFSYSADIRSTTLFMEMTHASLPTEKTSTSFPRRWGASKRSSERKESPLLIWLGACCS